MKQSTKDSLRQYVEHGVPTGDFLYAVLANNLTGAVFHADPDNLDDLYDIVRYVFNNMPTNCWGSRKIVDEWIDRKMKKREVKNA